MLVDPEARRLLRQHLAVAEADVRKAFAELGKSQNAIEKKSTQTRNAR
jgi:hypothetical protein